MFNGYNDTPPLMSFNDFDQEKEKKQENVSKWSYEYNESGPLVQTPGHNHQPEFWSPKPNFLGNTPVGNLPSKCNCTGCYSTDNQSYQNVSTRHRPWLPKTFPVPLNGSSETCKLPEYHQLDGINLTSQGSCFQDSNNVPSLHIQDNNGKHSHYRYYQNPRLPESNQPGVTPSSVNPEFAKKELFQNQKEDIPSNVIGQDLSFFRQNGTRQPVYCNTNSYGIIRNVEARLNNKNRSSNICDSLEKYSNIDLYRHPSSVASYSLDQHIARPSVVEPYIKTVPSNLNQNRVPSIGHRNMSQSYMDKVYNESKKNISSDAFQTISGEKKSVLPSTFQSSLIKEGTTSDNYQTAPLHGITSPALNLKNNGIPIDCTYFNINRDFSKSYGNLSDGETQKLVYMSDRYSDYITKNSLPDLIKRNNPSHVLEGKKEYTAGQINPKNYYEQQSNNFHRSNNLSNGTEYLEPNSTKASFGAFYPKELENAKITKSEMFDLVQDNPPFFQRKDEIIKNENMNIHPRIPRPAPVFNDPRAMCVPSKSQNCFSSSNGETIPFGNFINSDYSYQEHHLQGHHAYSYSHNSVPFQRNDLNQYNHGNLYQQIPHNNSQTLPVHSNNTVIFTSQAQPLTNSQITSPQFCAEKSHLSSNNIELKSPIPQNERPKFCSPDEVKKQNYLESIRSEEINKNGNSKISPLRLLRKKKNINLINEVSNDTTSYSNSSDSAPALDVRKFWSTWADEEEENVIPTQVVVLDCQNIGMEEAKLLHLYENEPVRALHLENGNLITFREPDCEKTLTENTNNQYGSDLKESRIQSQQIEITNEIKKGSDDISKPVHTSQGAIVQSEKILSAPKSFSENLKNEKITEVFDNETNVTGLEPTSTKFAKEELATHKKLIEEPPTNNNETRFNFSQENIEANFIKKFDPNKKKDNEVLKLDKWTEKKFDFLKRAEESKAAEILRNSEEKKKIFERRYSFQQYNFQKKVSAEFSNLSDGENSSAKIDVFENRSVVTPKEDSMKNFSLNESSLEHLESKNESKFSSLPTSEYRRNKFLNYSGKKCTNDHSNTFNEKIMTNVKSVENYCEKDKFTDNNSNILNEKLPGSVNDDIKKKENLDLKHSKSTWPLKRNSLLDFDEKKFQSQKESEMNFAKLKDETESHKFEIDDILQKMSKINFHSSNVMVDSSCGDAKTPEAKPIKVKKLKTLPAGKKIKKNKKFIHSQEDVDMKNEETENVSVTKPTIKFSIQKLHDLKISFKVLNGGKKYEKCTKDEDNRDKKSEHLDNSNHQSDNSTELITLKLQSIQRDDKASCDITKLDQKFSQNGILKTKKKRFKRKKLEIDSPLFASDIKPHKIKSKKGKHNIYEEKDPLAQDSNDEILFNLIEKQSDKYSSLDDFQVQETIDSAKIKLTFKRHKPNFNVNSVAVQNINTNSENQSNCISKSSKTTKPLCMKKSISKFDSPSERDTQLIKSESNWLDELDESESYNNFGDISEENQEDCDSASFSNPISSPYSSINKNNNINNNNENIDSDDFIENKSSPNNNSHSFVDIKDQCDSHGFENTGLNEKKIKKNDTEILKSINEEVELPHYSLTEKFAKVNEGDNDEDKIKNNKSNFSEVAIDLNNKECETYAESLENNILNCDEESNQTNICDETFMDCGPDIAMENESFHEIDESVLQITDPLKNDPTIQIYNKEKCDATYFMDMGKSLNEELIKCSATDTSGELYDVQRISQSLLSEERLTDSESCSNDTDPLKDEEEVINCDVTNDEKINKPMDVEELFENIEEVSKNDENELLNCSANQLKHSEKISSSYKCGSDVVLSKKEDVNFSSLEVPTSQTVEQIKESTSKNIISNDSPNEIEEIENIDIELSTPKDNVINNNFTVPETFQSEKICATTNENFTEDKVHNYIKELECEKSNLHKTKEAVISLKLNKNNSENDSLENFEKKKSTDVSKTFINVNVNNLERSAEFEKEEKNSFLQNAEPFVQNALECSIDTEKDFVISPCSPKCEKKVLNEHIDIDQLIYKSSKNNNNNSQCEVDKENDFKHINTAISNDVICTSSDKNVYNKLTSENSSTQSLLAETNKPSNFNYLKEKLETIKTVTENELIKKELHTSEKIIKHNENYEFSQVNHDVDKEETNENDRSIVKEFKELDKTENNHTQNPKCFESEQIVVADKNEKKEEKLIFSKSEISTDILFRVLKELTCCKSKKIQRRHSFSQKNFSEIKSNKIKESQTFKNNKIFPFFKDISVIKSVYSKYNIRRQKAKSCPPLKFSCPKINPVKIVPLNIPVEDIPLPQGDPPPENCFDFVQFFKKRKLENAIKLNNNFSLLTSLSQLEINGNADGCLPVNSKVNENMAEDNQNQFWILQEEISEELCSLDNYEISMQSFNLQNYRNPSPPPKTEDDNNSVDVKKNLNFVESDINNINSISSYKIDFEFIKDETEKKDTSRTEKVISSSFSATKFCNENKIKNSESLEVVESEQIIDKEICLEKIVEKEQEVEKLLLENIELPKDFEGTDRKTKLTNNLDAETTMKTDGNDEILTNNDMLETLEPTENSEEFDKNLIESQIEVVCEDFELCENVEEDLTVITGDDEPNNIIELRNEKFVEEKFYECEDIPTSEGLPNDDDNEVEKVSDDDKFRHMMQNCLDNAKKFLNVSNLKLFSCSVEDLLEMDGQFTDVTVEDGEPEKLAVDPTNHISKDVLLTSCDNEVNDDLFLPEKFQFNDLSVDFVPSFNSESSHNLCPEILPVDNWPYLEEEVPLSPTKSKSDETDLMPPLEGDEINSENPKQVPAYLNHAAYYTKNKLYKIQNNFDKLVNCNTVSLPGISHVDFKRFRRRSLVYDNERYKKNCKIGCQRRKTIDCLSTNKLTYSACNKDVQHFKTEVEKLKSGLEKIELLWNKSKNYKNSLNFEKMEKNENKGDKSVKRFHCFRAEAKNVKDSFKQDNFGIKKSSESILQKEKNNCYFKLPTWQPKVLLFRISKNELTKINSKNIQHLTSNENNFKRISKENFNKERDKDSKQSGQIPNVKDESLRNAYKEQNSQLNISKDVSNYDLLVKEEKNDKVKAYVRSDIKNSCEKEEILNNQLYKVDNFSIKTENAAISSSGHKLDSSINAKKEKMKHCDYTFELTTVKKLERNETDKLVFIENQVAPVKRKKSRFRNLYSKRKKEFSISDTCTSIPLKKNLFTNSMLVETELVLSELFKENDESKDLSLKTKTKSTKEFVNSNRVKVDDGREKKKSRHGEKNTKEFSEKAVKTYKDKACTQSNAYNGPHSKNNTGEHCMRREISSSYEKNVENSKHEKGLTASPDNKKSEENLKQNRNENSTFKKHDDADKKDISEKTKNKYKIIEKHRENSETKESRHAYDYRYKKKHGREKNEKHEFFKFKDYAHSAKKKLSIREENRKKSKLKESEQNVLSKSSNTKSENRVKIEESNLEGPWICEVCGFNDVKERVTHIKSHPFHCQSCHLAFNTEAHFISHLTKMHKDIKNQHHCLLCELSFDTENEYQKHLGTREHKHLESVEKNTINTLFTLLTGQPCPALGFVEMKPEWLPNQAGMVHFYHQATPLSLALQYLKMHHDLTAFSTLSSVNSP